MIRSGLTRLRSRSWPSAVPTSIAEPKPELRRAEQFRFGPAFEVMCHPLQAVTVHSGKELAAKRWRPPASARLRAG